MNLTDVINKLKELFPELVELSTDTPDMKGEYLYFNQLKRVSHKEDEAQFKIIVAGNSLTGDATPIIPKIIEYRKQLDKYKSEFGSIDIFRSVVAVSFKPTLFIYSIDVAIKIFNELDEYEVIS